MNKSLSAVEIAVEQALLTLRETPSALVTDIDGTISGIVSRPEDARVSPEIREALSRLSRQLSMVAVVTARQETVARAMVGVDSLTYVGNYAVDEAISGPMSPINADLLIGAVRPFLASHQCVTLEEKGIGFSLHYRNCADKSVRETIIDLLMPHLHSAGAKVVEGKQVLEAVPSGLPDKGTALTRLLDSAGIRGAVFVGDDLSDVAAFRALVRRREVDNKAALAIGVADDESPPSVREAADVELEGVPSVTLFLQRLAESLEEGGR